MSLCIVAAGKTVTLAVAAFTLSWTHSVERTRWREDWAITPAGLQIVEARVKGSGAGMEPAEGAVLRDGWWVYVPKLPPQRTLMLAASGATGGGWTLCTAQDCLTIGATAGAPVELRPCAEETGSSQPR
jgi:hypothetical protein